MDSFVESADNHQIGVMSPMIAECVDTPEYRFYVRTMGNPALKVVLDKQQDMLTKSQQAAAKRLCARAMEQIKMDVYEELFMLESKSSSTNIYNYFLAKKANSELEKEINELTKENIRISQEIKDLRRSMNEK